MSTNEEHSGSPSETVVDDDQALHLARRRLLRITAYAVPILLGTFSTRKAAAQSSCNPDTCPPATGCQPNCGPAGN